jgi:hypothetical protein
MQNRVVVVTGASAGADAYTRPGAQQMVAAYLGAHDMGLAELQPPFMTSPLGT